MRSLLPIIENHGTASATDIQIDTLAERLEAEGITLGAQLISPTQCGAWITTGFTQHSSPAVGGSRGAQRNIRQCRTTNKSKIENAQLALATQVTDFDRRRLRLARVSRSWRQQQ